MERSVLYTGENKYWAVADHVATEEEAALVRSVPDARPGVLYYVTSPRNIDEDIVLQLQQRLLRLGPENGAFGIITGQTPEAARELYERGKSSTHQIAGSTEENVNAQDSFRDEHAILLRDETRDWFSYDDETTVRTGDDVSISVLRDRLSDLESISMMIHGRSMHLFLSDGFICGFPKTRDADFDGKQPYCVSESNEPDCPLDGELLHADELTVPHLFIDSCASMLPENDYEGLPVHVGTGLLEGATSVIAGYRQVDALAQMSLLHYCLLRAGYSGAERCYLLNRAAHTYNTAAYPYLSFGHPRASLPGDGDPSLSYTVEGNRIVIEDTDAPIVDLTLDVPAEQAEWFVRNLTDKYEKAPIYACAFEEEDGVRLLVYTWGRFEIDELELELSNSPASEKERRLVEDALENVEETKYLNIVDPKASGQVSDLRNRLKGRGSEIHRQRYDTNAYRDAKDRLDNAMKAVERVQKRVVEAVKRRESAFLSDEYRGDFRKTTVEESSSTCPNCGRRLFEKRMENWSNTVTRIRGTCSLCGVVYDVPDAEDAITPPQVDGDFVPVSDEPVEFEISFRNVRDWHVHATYFPWIGADDQFIEGPVFEPSARTVSLAPGESNSVTFEIDPSRLANNEYWISMYVLSNLEVHQSLRKMVVGSEYGHRRADLLESGNPVSL